MQLASIPRFAPQTNRPYSSAVAEKVSEHPALLLADAVDISVGLSNGLGLLSGSPGLAMAGTGALMGVYHGCRAVGDLFTGITEGGMDGVRSTQNLLTSAAGNALCAAGHLGAAVGMGPASLGLLGIGLVIENACTLNG